MAEETPQGICSSIIIIINMAAMSLPNMRSGIKQYENAKHVHKQPDKV